MGKYHVPTLCNAVEIEIMLETLLRVIMDSTYWTDSFN